MSLSNFTKETLCSMSTLPKEIKSYQNWLNIIDINHLVKQDIQIRYSFDNSSLINTEKSSFIYIQTHRAIFYIRLSCLTVNIDGTGCL